MWGAPSMLWALPMTSWYTPACGAAPLVAASWQCRRTWLVPDLVLQWQSAIYFIISSKNWMKRWVI